MADPAALAALARLLDVMHRLRAPGGCPWDREQTPETLRPYVIEEAYEVVDAIDAGDPDALRDELGDLLLQVVFQAEIAAEHGGFDVGAVATAIADKLERRHPHVFGDVRVEDADEVVRNWKAIKARERAARAGTPDVPPGVLHGVPRNLPALARAQQVGSRLAHVGYDWPGPDGVLAKLDEERAELGAALATGDRAAAARELGDLLLTASSLARHLGVEAEMALRDATTRLESRVARVEAAARAAGRPVGELDDVERDRLWNTAKADEV
jgi:tetrapyrrole methylase family protein/MazG family protein